MSRSLTKAGGIVLGAFAGLMAFNSAALADCVISWKKKDGTRAERVYHYSGSFETTLKWCREAADHRLKASKSVRMDFVHTHGSRHETRTRNGAVKVANAGGHGFKTAAPAAGTRKQAAAPCPPVIFDFTRLLAH